MQKDYWKLGNIYISQFIVIWPNEVNICGWSYFEKVYVHTNKITPYFWYTKQHIICKITHHSQDFKIATKERETHFHRIRSYRQSPAKHNWELSQSWESQFQFFICLFLMKLICLHTVTGSEKSSNELVQLLLLRSDLLPPKWCRLAGLQISNWVIWPASNCYYWKIPGAVKIL